MATKFGALARAVDTDRKVLAKYEAYIMGDRNLFKEAEALTYILTKNQDRTETGQRDRTGSWSASSSGRCLREQQFTFLGFPVRQVGPDPQNIFLNGDYVHLRHQVAGLVGGWLRDVEVPLFHEGRVRGTMDGDLVDDEVLEIKSINDRGFASVIEFGPKEAHLWQATAYMICKGYARTRFLYENKNTNVCREFVFDLTQDWVDKVLEQWDRLNASTEARKLEPMLHECLSGKGAYKWCDFAPICEEAKFPRKKKLVLV